jgi:hypothetical protein
LGDVFREHRIRRRLHFDGAGVFVFARSHQLWRRTEVETFTTEITHWAGACCCHPHGWAMSDRRDGAVKACFWQEKANFRFGDGPIFRHQYRRFIVRKLLFVGAALAALATSSISANAMSYSFHEENHYTVIDAQGVILPEEEYIFMDWQQRQVIRSGYPRHWHQS